MTKHECDVPAVSARVKKWKCPVCRHTWRFDPNAGGGAEMWHGTANVRHANGTKPKSPWSLW